MEGLLDTLSTWLLGVGLAAGAVSYVAIVFLKAEGPFSAGLGCVTAALCLPLAFAIISIEFITIEPRCDAVGTIQRCWSPLAYLVMFLSLIGIVWYFIRIFPLLVESVFERRGGSQATVTIPSDNVQVGDVVEHSSVGVDTRSALAAERSHIQQVVRRRDISQLVHFSRWGNLPSILEHGIVPRRQLEELGVSYEYNDDLRLDHHLDACCLSVSFPNYRMFYKYQQSNADAGWIVVSVDPSVLWSFDCAFCFGNAACSEVQALAESDLRTANALEAMFGDRPEHGYRQPVPRAALSLDRNDFTTDPEAEVLVFAVIDPQYIKRVYVKFWEEARLASKLPFEVEVMHQPEMFMPRSDWQHWQASQ